MGLTSQASEKEQLLLAKAKCHGRVNDTKLLVSKKGAVQSTRVSQP